MKAKALRALSLLTTSTLSFDNLGETRLAISTINESIPDPAIAALDLDPIIVKIKKEKGWSMQTILVHCLFYKQFLFLCKTNPGLSIVPTEGVDEFWHTHIMDTRKYNEDCQAIFGSFLHHFPYFGMTGKQDERNWKRAFKNTKKILHDVFGIKNWGFAPAALCGPASCQGKECDHREGFRPPLELAFA